MELSSSQLLELFILLCTADHFRYDFSKYGSASAYAESKGGPVRPDSMPSCLYHIITPLQVFTYFLFPTIYFFAVGYDGLQQPPWMNALALPDMVYGVNMEGMWKNSVRVLACVASIALQGLSNDVFEHLSDQFHAIGRREKQRVVQTGPYTRVRHPLYAWILLEEVLFSLMFWSYAPLLAVVCTATVLAVKIFIEEEAIQRDETVGEEYRAYMQKVPAKLVPYVW